MLIETPGSNEPMDEVLPRPFTLETPPPNLDSPPGQPQGAETTLLPTSPSPAGDRWMNIFHGDETWQGRWNPENDLLLSFVDDPESFKMSVGNAHWIADQYGETLDAVGAAYPMAQMLVSQELLGHMDGTDEDVFRAIGDSLVPTLTMEDIAQVKTVPLSLAQYYLPDLVDEENWVPELDESRAYFQLGQFPLNLPIAQHEDRTPGEIEILGRARWDKSLEQKGTPAPQRNGNLATDIVKSFFGGMTESSFTMLEGPKVFGDKVAEFIPGYEGSFFDKWTNSEIAALQWQRDMMQNFYHVDPEFAQSYAGELTSTLGATVPQMLSMTLPPLAATMIGGQSFQYAWEDAENTAKRLGQPFNRNRAFAYALTMGAVNAAMTMVKFDLTVKPWLNAEARSLVNNAFKLLRTTLLGTVTNVGQGAANDALAWGFGIEPRNPFDPERRKHDALLGAGTSLVLSLGGMTLAPAAEKTAQPPPEKPAVTFDKSLGKQEVPPSVAESAKPDAIQTPIQPEMVSETAQTTAQSSDGAAGNSERLTYVGKSEDLSGKPRAAVEGLQFRDATGTDQATRDRVSSLEAALEEDARAVGAHPGAGKVRLLEASVANHSAAGRATLRFVSGFEKLTGKKIYWIDTEGAASFAAIVDTARPNAIYLYVQGNRAIPALIGHEWGHTLKKQDPALYRDLQLKLLPLIDSWKTRATALKEDGYRRQVRSEELTNNIIGDAFVHPDFWRFVAQRDRPLFARIVDSVNQWFASFRGKAKQSEWGTEEFIGDIDEAHSAVMETFSQAVEKGPYSELRDAPDAELSNRAPDGAEIMYSRSARELLDGDKPVPTALALQAMREAPDHPVTRALKSWFVGGFRDIQNGKAPETEAILRKFLLRLPPYESKTPLYRGVPFRNEPELRAFLKQFQGDEWVNTKPFMSATKEPRIASNHAQGAGYPVFIEIQGVHAGRDLEPFKKFAQEFEWQKEVLYLQGAKFRVLVKPKLIEFNGKTFYYIQLEENK